MWHLIGVCSYFYKALQMLVIGVRDKPMKMLMVFLSPFSLNNEYWGNFKGGVLQSIGVRRGLRPLAANCPHDLGTWGSSLAVKPEIVGVAGANMQWSHFVCPSFSQKRESTAFDLILFSNPSKQVGRSSTPCR